MHEPLSSHTRSHDRTRRAVTGENVRENIRESTVRENVRYRHEVSMDTWHLVTWQRAGYCTDGASRKPVVSGRRASTKAGAASLLPVMCSCQILAIRRCLCRRRSTSTSTTSRIRSTTAPGMPASKATGSHDGDEGPADGGVLGGLGPEPASLLSASMAPGACRLSASSMVLRPG